MSSAGTNRLAEFDLCYLATPYRIYPGGQDKAAIDAARLTARLLNSGVMVYSPIVHGHQLTLHGKISADDYDFWRKVNLTMLIKSGALIMAMMDSWEESDGMADELHFAAIERKPIFYLDPETLSIGNCLI